MDRYGARHLGPPSYLVASHGATALLTTLIVLATTPRDLAESVPPANLVTVVSHGLLGVTGTGTVFTFEFVQPAPGPVAIRWAR